MNTNALSFGNNFLNHILLNLIIEDKFIARIKSINNLDTLFKTREKRFIANLCLDYYNEYKHAPKDHFYDLFEDAAADMEQKSYERCLNLIETIQNLGNSNWEYVAGKLNDAIRHHRLEDASVDFAKLIKQQNYEEAKNLILTALRSSNKTDNTWFDYGTDQTFVQERLDPKNRYKMKFMINSMDEVLGGLNPPELINVLGTTKGGKSWFLIEMAIAGVLQGLNVVFISLEMGDKQIRERFDQAVGFMSIDQQSLITQKEVMHQHNNRWSKHVEEVDSIYNVNKVMKNSKALYKSAGGRLIIQAFNRGRLNYIDIDNFLEQLSQTEGFLPHLLIVDYLGIMKETEPNQSKKERISENCLGLKDICSERNIICISAMQGNRSAMSAKVFKSSMIADDIDTVWHSDLILALCQTEREAAENKQRIYVANNRHGPQFIQFGIIRDLTIGQIALGEYDIQEDQEENAPPSEASVDEVF